MRHNIHLKFVKSVILPKETNFLSLVASCYGAQKKYSASIAWRGQGSN